MKFKENEYNLTVGKMSSYKDMGTFLHENQDLFEPIQNYEKVLIKVNIPFWKTPPGSLTNRLTLLELIEAIEAEFNVQTFVVESRYGFIPTKVGDEYGIRSSHVIDMFETTAFNVPCRMCMGNEDHSLKISKLALRNSKVFKISLGPPKTHEFVIYSGAIKTKMGFLKEKRRYMHGLQDVKHFNDEGFWEEMVRTLHQNLIVLNRNVHIDLSILDGSSCMEGNGPVFGKEVKWDMIAASNSPEVLDYVISSLMCFNPKDIAYIWLPLRSAFSLVQKLDDALGHWVIYDISRPFEPPERYDEELFASRKVIEEMK